MAGDGLSASQRVELHEASGSQLWAGQLLAFVAIWEVNHSVSVSLSLFGFFKSMNTKNKTQPIGSTGELENRAKKITLTALEGKSAHICRGSSRESEGSTQSERVPEGIQLQSHLHSILQCF